MRNSLRSAAAALSMLAVTGCSGWPAVIDPSSPQARHLANLFWLFTIVCAVVWFAVMLALGLAMYQGRNAPERGDPLEPNEDTDRHSSVVVSAAVAATVVVLIVLTWSSYLATPRISDAAQGDALMIRVTGFQWWWEIRYDDKQPERIVTTANEIHLPVGRPVKLRLSGADVIHSFWIPSLAGKQDLIPGRDNDIALVAQRSGIYRGQCAEFCGLQHAHMGILVSAESPEVFETWREAQIRPAQPPADAERQLGLAVFQKNGCGACHT